MISSSVNGDNGENAEIMIENHQKMTRRISKGDYRAPLVNIEEEYYPISYEVLHQIFSSFEHLKDITVFESGSKFHSRFCFQSREAAVQAIQSLQDRCIYDDCCRLKILLATEATCLTQGMRQELNQMEEKQQLLSLRMEGMNQEFAQAFRLESIDSSGAKLVDQKVCDDIPKAIDHPLSSSTASILQQGNSSQSVSSQSVHFDIEIVDNSSGLVDEIDVVESDKVKSLNLITINSTNIYAHNMFDEMPRGIEGVISQPESDEHACDVRVSKWQQEEPDVFYTSPIEKFIGNFIAKELSDFYAHNMLDVMSGGGIRKKLSENLEIIGEYATNCGIMTYKMLQELEFLVKLMKVSGGLSVLTKESSGDHKIHEIKDLSVAFDRGKLELAVLGVAIMVFDLGGMQGVSNCHAIGNLEGIGVKVFDTPNIHTRHDIEECYQGILDDPWGSDSIIVGLTIVTVRSRKFRDAN